jgi:hypothetical protein
VLFIPPCALKASPSHACSQGIGDPNRKPLCVSSDARCRYDEESEALSICELSSLVTVAAGLKSSTKSAKHEVFLFADSSVRFFRARLWSLLIPKVGDRWVACYLCAIYVLFMCYLCAIYVLFMCYSCAIYTSVHHHVQALYPQPLLGSACASVTDTLDETLNSFSSLPHNAHVLFCDHMPVAKISAYYLF